MDVKTIMRHINKHTPKKPITAIALSTLIDRSERRTREIVETLRRKGEPIGSHEGGYWRIRSQKQLDTFIKWYKSEVSSRYRTANTMKKRWEQRRAK